MPLLLTNVCPEYVCCKFHLLWHTITSCDAIKCQQLWRRTKKNSNRNVFNVVSMENGVVSPLKMPKSTRRNGALCLMSSSSSCDVCAWCRSRVTAFTETYLITRARTPVFLPSQQSQIDIIWARNRHRLAKNPTTLRMAAKSHSVGDREIGFWF